MAQRITFYYVDDLGGARIDIEDLHTVAWSWAGVDYQFHTSTANLDNVMAGNVFVSTLLAKSVRTGSDQSGTARRRAVPVIAAGSRPAPALAVNLGEVRKWALENHHYGVAKRGRLSKTVINAYNRAHPTPADSAAE